MHRQTARSGSAAAGLVSAALALFAFAAPVSGQMSAAAAPLAPAAGAPRPVAQLPSRVVAPSGALALYADYAGARGDRIDLYLVNRTAAPISVPAQDGDVYAKLEVQRNGRWQRAERHVYSDCGNSYRTIRLAPGEFVAWSGYHPASGPATTVRYALHSKLATISNTGPGHYDPAELAAASRDALAMQGGDLATLRAALLGDKGPDAKSVRRHALDRLAKLNPAAAVPVVEQFLATGAPDDNEYTQALHTLHTLEPARVVRLVRATLEQPPSAARTRLVHELPFLPRLSDPGLSADLLTRARDPKSSDAASLLDTLGAQRTPEVAELLVGITRDAAYPDELRQRARYLHEEYYGDRRVQLRLQPVGAYGNGHAMPVFVDVELENTTPQKLTFEYREPSEILSFYLTVLQGREKTFLPTRPGVQFFAPSAAKTEPTKVVLAPKQRHTIRAALATYFDLRALAGLTVWVSCKLPGVHTIAELGGGGSGIDPRL